MFSRGQKIICVADDFSPKERQLYSELPTRDSIYTVREVFSITADKAVIRNGHIIPNGSYEATHGLGLIVEELKNPVDSTHPERELGFVADRFAPLMEAKEEEEEPENSYAIPGLAWTAGRFARLC